MLHRVGWLPASSGSASVITKLLIAFVKVSVRVALFAALSLSLIHIYADRALGNLPHFGAAHPCLLAAEIIACKNCYPVSNMGKPHLRCNFDTGDGVIFSAFSKERDVYKRQCLLSCGYL